MGRIVATSMGQEGPGVRRHQAGDVGPALVGITRAPEPLVQRRRVVRAQPGMEEQFVGAGHDVDTVDLDDVDVGQHPPEVPTIDP